MPFMRAATAFILGCSLVWPAYAQENACQQRTIPISLGTTDGALPPSLDSANLEATFRKKPIHIRSIATNQEPVRVFLLLDTSGSMHGITSASEKNFSVLLAEDLAFYVEPVSEIGLAFFNTDLVPVSAPTRDRRSLVDQLESLNSHPSTFKGKTALWNAIDGSVNMFDHPHLGDAVYLITDGNNNSGKIKMERAAQDLGEVGVRLFAFIIQNGSNHHAEELLGPDGVAQIVDDTGGVTVISKGEIAGDFPITHETALFKKSGKLTQLGLSLDSQYRQIASFYRVTIDLPEIVDKSQEWKLNLAGFSKAQRDNLTLTYPHMLVPCH